MYRIRVFDRKPAIKDKAAIEYPIRSPVLYNSSCYLKKAETNSSRNIWAPGLCDLEYLTSSKNRPSYTKSNSNAWSSERKNYESPSYSYVSEWSTPFSMAETHDFSKILGLQEDKLFYWQVPMRSTACRDDISYCSYMDINESGFQICDNFEDDFDEIKEMLDGRKGWGDYFDDGDLTDGSEISDGDPRSIDTCSHDTDFYHSQEFGSSGTDEFGFHDREIDFYHCGEVESSETDELAFADCQSGTADNEAPLEFNIIMTETDEFSFSDCQTGPEDDEALMVAPEICGIDLYHSEDIESSETDELVFHDCETGTEDDE